MAADASAWSILSVSIMAGSLWRGKITLPMGTKRGSGGVSGRRNEKALNLAIVQGFAKI